MRVQVLVRAEALVDEALLEADVAKAVLVPDRPRVDHDLVRRDADLGAQADHLGVVAHDLLRLVELLHRDGRLDALGLLVDRVERGLAAAEREGADGDEDVAREAVDEVRLGAAGRSHARLERLEVGRRDGEAEERDDLVLERWMQEEREREGGQLESSAGGAGGIGEGGRTLKERDGAGLERLDAALEHFGAEACRRERDLRGRERVVRVVGGHGLGAAVCVVCVCVLE